MQISAKDFCKEVSVLFINDDEFFMTLEHVTNHNPYEMDVVEFQDKKEIYSMMYVEATTMIEVDHEGKGTLELKNTWDDGSHVFNFQAYLLTPFNKANRAKKAIGAL